MALWPAKPHQTSLGEAESPGLCVLGASCRVLLIALVVSMALTNFELYENSQWLLTPHWVMLLVLTLTATDFFQALLLEQIGDSATTLRKNLW